MTLLGKIARRSPAELWMALEAWVLLAFFRICLAAVPVHRIIASITHGKASDTGEKVEPTERAIAFAQRVRWAVSAVARHSVVEFVCFPQSLAGYVMLRRRKVPSTIVYGVMRSPDKQLLAHTWLMVGDTIVLGGDAASEFSAIERWS